MNIVGPYPHTSYLSLDQRAGSKYAFVILDTRRMKVFVCVWVWVPMGGEDNWMVSVLWESLGG